MSEGLTSQDMEDLFQATTLGEAPASLLDAISVDLRCACEVAVFLCLKRGEDEDGLSDDEVMKRCQRIIWNMSCESLRRKIAPKRAKLFFLRDIPLLEIDQEVHHLDPREMALGIGYMFREKTGIEVTEEVAYRLYRESLGLNCDR
jgi:hypothetical protein